MKDIQSLRDDRRINIRKVGVKTISYPVTVLDKEHKTQQTVATVNMYVNLPHRFKGTHMSRFVDILNRFHGRFNLRSFHLILEEMKQRLEAEAAHLEIGFPYFLQKTPVDGRIGLERYECRMHGSLGEEDDLVLVIEVPISIPRGRGSDEGMPRSMGRWGNVRVAVRFNHFIWIEDLIAMIEDGLGPGSGLPESVESVCSRLGGVLAENPAIRWYNVIVENLADGYSTFASLQGPCKSSAARHLHAPAAVRM